MQTTSNFDALFAGPALLVVLVLALALLNFVLMLWGLIDCLTKEPSEGNDKIVWAIVILVLAGLGGLLYLLIRRPARIRDHGS